MINKTERNEYTYANVTFSVVTRSDLLYTTFHFNKSISPNVI